MRAAAERLPHSCLAVFLLGLTLFLIRLQLPGSLNFDEAHYVPSARQWLELVPNRNFEHPPLGKLLVAAGMAVAGDHPFGWRISAAVFGALTLAGMHFWAWGLFRDARRAGFATALTVFNFLLFVQARIGMLDTFMFAFLAWGLGAFAWAWDEQAAPARTRRLLLFAGAMFGFAVACKWSAVVAWATCLGLLAGARLLALLRVRRPSPGSWRGLPGYAPWYGPGLFQGVGVAWVALSLLAVPVLCYFSTFLPYLWIHRDPPYSILDFWRLQTEMYAGQLRVTSSHPYMSDWKGWPFLARPIWYAFDRAPDEGARGVLLVQNPLIAWAGILAVIYCAWAWLEHRCRQAFLIFVTWSALYFSWALIPRKITFYYYYYPAGMVLSFALAYALYRGPETVGARARWLRAGFLGLAAILFAYFYPILAAVRIDATSFTRWAWFRSWI